MKCTIQVVYHANSVCMNFFDQEKAKAAYTKISEALKEYKLFKNDRAETIEVDAEGGLSTLKLERIDAILFNEAQEFNEDVWRKRLEEERSIRALRTELGLPDLPTS